MGGDTATPSSFSEEESSLEEDFPELSSEIPPSSRDVVIMKHDTVNIENSFNFEAKRRRRDDACREILQSYEELHFHSKNLEEAKARILSYTPGTWIEKVGGRVMSDYDFPSTTSLILVGPKGSGKSSLINRISKVFEDDKYASERAQVSYNSSTGEGTLFLQEYMIPRSSTNFCLYDTRSLCDDLSDNMKMLKRWMTKGVHHAEVVIRDSDSLNSKCRMKCKARQNGYHSCETRMVNFVIFVVDGLSVLKSIESNDEEGKWYSQLIATTFSCPYLSFRDDKPVVVLTHGDLLSLSDRVRIRVHLGELLGIPPAKQIFDIPESSDPVTERTIVDMIRYSLEHADRNIPQKNWVKKKICTMMHPAYMRLLICVLVVIIAAIHVHPHLHCLDNQPVTNMLFMRHANSQPEAELPQMHQTSLQPEADLPQMPPPQPEADLPHMHQASPQPEADLPQAPRFKTKLPKKHHTHHLSEAHIDWGRIRNLWLGPD